MKDLAVSFDTFQGEVQAVRGVSWHLNKGETIAIVGESGCGKTVSIQTVLRAYPKGASRVKSGEVLFEGESLLGKSPREMRAYQGDRMSVIFQDPFTYLNPTMTVGDQIAENYLRHRAATRTEAGEKVLQIMKLINMPSPESTLRRYPHQLSGGMRQRIMIAIAIICDPEVLFADEPTTALDVTIQAQIIDLMNELKSKLGTAIVLITHDMGVVANMADRIYIMYAGKIVEHGTAEAIFKKPGHPYTRGLLGAVPRIDRKSDRELASIMGSPPDLIAPPRGCAFAARCPSAMNICAKAEPGFLDLEEGGHYAACWIGREGGTLHA
ncbi:MAG: ABC transporter ATP-binding protein [Spirochaetaceae bacterium]|nr:ABC transporter ATP-binding protein [Spirochaetaceae bacterium]